MTARSTAEKSEINQAVMAKDISYIKDDLKDIKDILTNNYVTKDAFIPVKRIAYGLVAAVGTALVGGVIAILLVRAQ